MGEPFEKLQKAILEKQYSDFIVDPRFKRGTIYEDTKFEIDKNNVSSNPYILGRCKVILSKLDTPTQNGTYYSNEWADKSILQNKNFNERLSKKLILGETDHPDKPDGSIFRVSHSILKVWKEGKDLWGLVEVYNTPAGQIAWTLLNADVKLGVSSRGIGDEIFDNGIKKINPNNFECLGWDFVINASAVGAGFMEFAESKKILMRETMSKLQEINKKNNDNLSGKILESFRAENEIKLNNEKLFNEVKSLKEEIVSKERTNKNLIKINEKYIKENQSLKKEIKSVTKTINENKFFIESKGKDILTKEDEIKLLKEKISLLESELKDSKDKVIKYVKENEEIKNSKNEIKVILEERKEIKNEAINPYKKFVVNYK